MGFLGDKYRAYKDAKEGRSNARFSEADIQKYTGRSRAELDRWAQSTEGVGANQKAGSLTAGGTYGPAVGEYSTFDVAGPLKFPPPTGRQMEEKENEQKGQEGQGQAKGKETLEVKK
ncbi:hypothetical protein Micbo1qcDRAFT_171006 [Microdochium bolleyi]|uniref:Uncharacterized protein n=1 Tax=Microdochium bolleyi TaxID=196109 RepID=A0A136JJH8_9PEZI|nr:hypothetical protein Micbo1qcDRAFT_171006 [Microdochium bolleyi]